MSYIIDKKYILTEEEINENIRKGVLSEVIRKIETGNFKERDLKKLGVLEIFYSNCYRFIWYYITKNFLIIKGGGNFIIIPLKYIKYCRMEKSKEPEFASSKKYYDIKFKIEENEYVEERFYELDSLSKTYQREIEKLEERNKTVSKIIAEAK